jgi:hypothetical protein
VKILGSVRGAAGPYSGYLLSNSAIASIYIGGDLVADTGFDSGTIAFYEKPASKITIMGDVIGGVGTDSHGENYTTGEIRADGGFGSLYIGKSLIGGQITNFNSESRLGSITIVGSLVGAATDFSGNITNKGPTGNVVVGGDLQGGAGQESGAIAFDGDVKSVTIRGSIRGAIGLFSGNIGCYEDAGSIFVGGSVLGADGDLSGAITSYGSVASITIKGDLVGGSGAPSGIINPPTSINSYIGKVNIGGSIIGGAGPRAGSVWSLGTIAAMTVGGSVTAGTGDSSGAIRANEVIKSLTIEGNVTGNTDQPVYITAGGIDYKTHVPEATTAIGTLLIKGNVSRTEILAGWDAKADRYEAYTHLPAPVNGNASINSVEVRGTWAASDLVAGARDSSNDGFGRNDALIVPNSTSAIAKIAKVQILGAATGSTVPGEFFGIVAEQIGHLTAGGIGFALTSGKDHGEIENIDHTFAYLEV